VNEEVLASKGLTFLVSRRAALDLLSLPLPSLPSFLLTSSTQLHHSSPLSVLLYLLQLFLSLQTVIHHRIVQSQILNCKYSAVGSMFIHPSIHSNHSTALSLFSWFFLLLHTIRRYHPPPPPLLPSSLAIPHSLVAFTTTATSAVAACCTSHHSQQAQTSTLVFTTCDYHCTLSHTIPLPSSSLA